jgi:hypothetical protein
LNSDRPLEVSGSFSDATLALSLSLAELLDSSSSELELDDSSALRLDSAEELDSLSDLCARADFGSLVDFAAIVFGVV